MIGKDLTKNIILELEKCGFDKILQKALDGNDTASKNKFIIESIKKYTKILETKKELHHASIKIIFDPNKFMDKLAIDHVGHVTFTSKVCILNNITNGIETLENIPGFGLISEYYTAPMNVNNKPILEYMNFAYIENSKKYTNTEIEECISLVFVCNTDYRVNTSSIEPAEINDKVLNLINKYQVNDNEFIYKYIWEDVNDEK